MQSSALISPASLCTFSNSLEHPSPRVRQVAKCTRCPPKICAALMAIIEESKPELIWKTVLSEFSFLIAASRLNISSVDVIGSVDSLASKGQMPLTATIWTDSAGLPSPENVDLMKKRPVRERNLKHQIATHVDNIVVILIHPPFEVLYQVKRRR